MYEQFWTSLEIRSFVYKYEFVFQLEKGDNLHFMIFCIWAILLLF